MFNECGKKRFGRGENEKLTRRVNAFIPACGQVDVGSCFPERSDEVISLLCATQRELRLPRGAAETERRNQTKKHRNESRFCCERESERPPTVEVTQHSQRRQTIDERSKFAHFLLSFVAQWEEKKSEQRRETKKKNET
jgi:hypothetical protein